MARPRRRPIPFGGFSIAIVDDSSRRVRGRDDGDRRTGRATARPRVPVESKLVIVGSGPAGLTAAIYAARANLEPIVLAGSAAGGQLMLTSDVENYPGFPDGIQGPDLMAAMRAQAERFGSRLIDVDIDHVDFSARPFRIWARGVEYRARGRDRRDRRLGAVARPRERDPPSRAGRVGMRHVRRVLLPRPRDRRRRRRRHRVRGGAVPDPLRDEGPPAPPTRQLPCVEDHGRPRLRPSEDRDPSEHGRRGGPRRAQGRRRAAGGHEHRAPSGRCPSMGCSSPSATDRIPRRSATGSTSTRRATSSSTTRPARRSRASSSPATSTTTATARP